MQHQYHRNRVAPIHIDGINKNNLKTLNLKLISTRAFAINNEPIGFPIERSNPTMHKIWRIGVINCHFSPKIVITKLSETVNRPNKTGKFIKPTKDNSL